MKLTPEQVKEIFDRQFAEVKDFLTDGVIAHNKKGELPEPWVGYASSWKQRRELGPHIVTGEFPEHLFLSRAPNQTDEELKWMRENYKQTTLPVFLDLENTVSRALHPSNWSLDFDEAAEETKEYIESGINEWGSVYNFLRFAGLRIKMQDAMGVLVVAPSQVDVIEGEDGMVIDPDQEIKPDIHYFTCEQLWGFKYDQWYLVRLHENSKVTYGNKTTETGVLCWLVDSENVWRIEQVGKKTDWTFDISIEFPHKIGYPPCINMMGTPAVKSGKLVWESPYLAAKDLLDIAMLDEHYLRASKAKVVFPHAVMVGDPCEFYDNISGAQCNGGWIEYIKDDKTERKKCPTCHGTGHKHRMSPFGTLVLNTDPNSTRPDAVNATTALSFVSPSTESVRFIREEIQTVTVQARSILHLDAETPMEGGDQKTATEAGLNNRAKDAFVKTIADQVFVIFGFLIDSVGKMRNGPTWDAFVLRPPTNYDLRTEQDHLNEISQAIEKGLPPALLMRAIEGYVLAKYQGDPGVVDLFRALTRADRLAGMPAAMVQAEVTAGRAKSWESLLHFSGIAIYEKLRADQSFVDATIEDQVDRLKKEAQTMAPDAAPTPMSRLNAAIAGQPRMSVVKAAEPAEARTTKPATPNSAQEAPVQDTALNGSQVTSLVEIINQMSVGVITKETGAALMRAAFPSMDEGLITRMISGIKPVNPASVKAEVIK